MMHLSVLLFISFFDLAWSITFTLDCTDVAQPCNNDCYGVYVFAKPSELNWDQPTSETKNARRKAAGCDPNPCDGSQSFLGDSTHTSCDEYPFAATEEGGTSSILRCTDEDQNLQEGRLFGGFTSRSLANGGCGSMACTFTMAFTNLENSPFCTSKAGPNDGQQFEYIDGEYELAKRGLNESTWKPVLPDPELFFPPHLRREFLLDDGQVVLLLTRDTEKSWEKEIFTTANGTARVVRELRGMEKSPAFRPPQLQAQKFNA